MNRNRFLQGLKSNIQLSEKERRRIIRRSLQKHSWKTKCTVAMEEFAELQQQISKQVRGYGFLSSMPLMVMGVNNLLYLISRPSLPAGWPASFDNAAPARGGRRAGRTGSSPPRRCP